MTTNQRTLRGEAGIDGYGLFTGRPVTVSFKPAPVDHGIVLYRTDIAADGHPARIPAIVQNVAYHARRTVLRSGDASVETCEHVLSAIAGLGIDNVRVEVMGPEMPMADGSALPFVRTLESAGLEEQDGLRRSLRITKPVAVANDRGRIDASPIEGDSLIVSYDLDYGPNVAFRPQIVTHSLHYAGYVSSIAAARTFVLDHEFQALQRDGLCTHLTPHELLVIGPDGPLGGMDYRFPNEHARHKVLDVIGDLVLLGRPLWGRIRAHRSGHALNQALVRELYRMLSSRR